MTAPVPLTLDELLHAVVEACVQEITAARHEVAIVRAATAAERRDLERERDEARLEGQDAAETVIALRRRVTELERETAKASKVSTTSPIRQPDRESVKQPPAPPSLPEPRRFDPRGKAIDFKGVKVGTFEGIEPTSDRRVGAVVWIFRCTLCGEERRWSSNNVNAIRKRSGSSFRCTCQGGAPSARNTTGRAYRGPGQPVRHIPVEREHVNLDEDMAELDDGFRGDPEDLKGLSSGGLGFE